MGIVNNRRTRIAAEVRAELARQGKSLTALAAATGLTTKTLRRRLDGVRPFYLDELDNISRFLGVSLVELVARSEPADV